MATPCQLPAGSYIVKVSGDCNLFCPYCYHFKERCRKKYTVLALNLLEDFMRQAVEYSPKRVWFIWHGGEPLFAGYAYFEKIVEIQAELTEQYGTKFRNSIQTNGTLITKRWAEFFKKHNFGVGVSLDGFESLHNINRIYQKGAGSFQQVMRGVRLLRDVGIHPSAICVITKDSLGNERKLFDFFIENGFLSFEFSPCAEIENDSGEIMPNSITDEEFGDFMVKMFDIWIEHDDPKIRIRYFQNVLDGLLGKRPKSCTFNGSCGKFVTITDSGVLLPCDNFIGNPELTFGRIQDHSLTTLLNGQIRQTFFTQANIIRSECSTCEFLHACNGACRNYSYMHRGRMDDPNYFCGSRKKVFAHVAKRLEEFKKTTTKSEERR